MPDRGLLQNFTPGNLAKRLLGVKADEVPKYLASPDLMGIVELGRRGEFELLREQGILPFVCSTTVGAVAAQFSRCEIAVVVPGIAIVERFEAVGAAISVSYHYNDVGGGTPQTVLYRDQRDGGQFGINPFPFVQVLVTTQAGAPVTPRFWKASATTPFPPPILLPLTTASNLNASVQANTVNVGIDVNISGYFLPAE